MKGICKGLVKEFGLTNLRLEGYCWIINYKHPSIPNVYLMAAAPCVNKENALKHFNSLFLGMHERNKRTIQFKVEIRNII